MALSSRVVALVLIGLVPVGIWPGGWTVRLWMLLVLVVIGLDLLLAASPRRIAVSRRPLGKVRVSEETVSELLVANPTGRRLRGLLRDAWQPSAGASPDRMALDVPAGERLVMSVYLCRSLADPAAVPEPDPRLTPFARAFAASSRFCTPEARASVRA